MGPADEQRDRAEVRHMQAALRTRVVQAAAASARGLRSLPPGALLGLFCAAALSPLGAVSAGLGAAAVAGSGVLSSVGGGVLSAIIAGALDRARSEGKDAPAAEFGQEIAEEIERVLTAETENAQALRAEIAAVLERIDAGGTALRAAMEQTNERIRDDILAAIEELSWSYDETHFLMRDVIRAAAEIQKSLDLQGAGIRTIVEQNNRQSTDIRLVREGLAAIASPSHRDEPDGGREDGRPSLGQECPYRGLLPFEESDAEVFYGRERLIAELAVRVTARVTDGGLIVITGASGAGKSSLLRAGLLPALARGQQVEGSGRWPRVVMTPNADPLGELASGLAGLGAGNSIALRESLRLHPEQAHTVVRSALTADAVRAERAGEPPRHAEAVRVVLVIDQFEQVFTLNRGLDAEAGRQVFIAALCAAATTRGGPGNQPPALVVIAVRGDFWDRCAAYPELALALQDGQFVVGPMTESELRLAITGPADTAGLRIDPGLTDTILSDLRAAGNDYTGALPLLSQAMLLTWTKRDGDRLTGHGYGLTGGVSSAVQTSADGVYDALPAAHQALARDLLRRMTVVGRDGRLSRRPVTRADLYADHAEAERSGIGAVLEEFARARLVVVDGDRVQIAHDALLQAWPRLRGWLEEDQASSILLGQLAGDADAWRDNARDPSFLYRGTQLAAVRQAGATWAAHSARFPALTAGQDDFLQASERLAARGTRQRRIVVAALVVLLAAALGSAGVAGISAANANSQRNKAVASQLAVESETLDTADPVVAAQLATAAWRIDRSDPQVADSMLDLLAQPERGLLKGFQPGPRATAQPLAFSPNGRLLAIRSGEKVSLFSTATNAPVGKAMGPGDPDQAATEVAFSPDGTMLATDDGGTVLLWNVATQAVIGTPLAEPGRSISAFAFSPAGNTIATITSDGYVQLWNAASQSRVGGSIKTGADDISFGPDGKTLVTMGTLSGPVQVWNAADGQEIGSPLAVGQSNAIAVSPDGTMLAVADYTGHVQLWNLNTRGRIGAPLAAAVSPGGVQTMAFSRQGTLAVVNAHDNSVTLWNTAEGTQIGAALDNSEGFPELAFNPAGTILGITGDEEAAPTFWNVGIWHQDRPRLDIGDAQAVAFNPAATELALLPQTISDVPVSGKVQVWNLPAGVQAGTLPDIGQVMGVAFSGDGKKLATIYYPPERTVNAIQLWNASSLARAGTPWTIDGPGGILLNRNGTIAVATGTVELWNVVTHAEIGHPMIPEPIEAHEDVVLSPDGKTIGQTSVPGSLTLWDAQTSRQIGSALTTSGADQVAFSPDGRLFATGDVFGTAQLWSLATRAPVGGPLNAGDVSQLAFSPDGRFLATGTLFGTIQLWDTTTGAPVGAPLQMGGGPVIGLAFSADSGTLVAATSTTVQSWDVSFPANLLAAACSIAGGSLTPRQWELYAPSEAFQSTCPYVA